MESKAYIGADSLYRMIIDSPDYNIIISESKQGLYNSAYYEKKVDSLFHIMIKNETAYKIGDAILEAHRFLIISNQAKKCS
jgi:hypothetical protein